MKSFELLESWRNDGLMKSITDGVEILDEHSFCFPDVRLISFSNKTDSFIILFEINGREVKLCINNPISIAMTKYDKNGDGLETYLEINDIGGKLKFIIENHFSGLFISMFAIDATLEPLK